MAEEIVSVIGAIRKEQEENPRKDIVESYLDIVE